jgi:hypothetical protein
MDGVLIKSELDDCTAKRLCNVAQGCRAARLPWVTGSNDNNPNGVVSVFGGVRGQAVHIIN